MSARIVPFPRSQRCRHAQEAIDAALLVQSIAIKVFEQNDAWHRIEGFEKAIKSLPGGRENLDRYIAVFGSDPYELAIRGPVPEATSAKECQAIVLIGDEPRASPLAR